MKRFWVLALAAAAFAGAAITPETPSKDADGCYAISTAEELFGFAKIVNASKTHDECGKLTANIIVNKPGQEDGTVKWEPISFFSGSFDGQGHTIEGLALGNSTTNEVPALPNAGLFGVVSSRNSLSPVRIKNLTLKGVNFFDIDNGGGLIGKIDSLSNEVVIENCDVEISIGVLRLEEDVRGYRGGLVGLHQGGWLTIKESHVEGHFYGAGTNAGLVAGTTGTVRIFNSYCQNNFSDAAEAALVGTATNANVYVENSYALSRYTPSDQWNGVYNLVGKTENSYVKYSNVFRMHMVFFSETPPEGVHEFYDEQVEDGTIARVLHLFKSGNVDGSVWGQNVGTDEYPTLSGKIDGGQSLKLSALHLITYDADTVTYSKQYIEGIESSLPLPERKDYEFAGWYDNENFYGKSTTTIPKDATGDKTFYAKWWHIPKFVNNCYEIALIDELYYFANLYNRQQYSKNTCVKLTADLVDNKKVVVGDSLNTADSSKFCAWTPIQKFKGTFDGQGHSISGLIFVGNDGNPNAGLFASVGEENEVSDEVVIKNLGIKDSYFEGRRKSGSLVGQSASGTNLYVSNVYSECVINSWNTDIGGLIGAFNADSGKQSLLYLVNAYHKGHVGGGSYVGGLVGSIEDAKTFIVNAYHSGLVQGGSTVGGLVGEVTGGDDSRTFMAYVYNDGLVNASRGAVAGGLIANQYTSTTIQNAYNAGDVTAKTRSVGGIVSQSSNPIVLTNVFNKGTLLPDSYSDALVAETNKNYKLTADNVFFFESVPSKNGGSAATADAFADLSLAKKLHDYAKGDVNGEGWTQAAGDPYPNFKKDVVEAYAEQFIVTPSEPSSSSSSVVESSSSSESGKTSPVVSRAVSLVNVRSVGRMVEISGMQAGEGYALLDMQGRLLQRGYASGSSVSLNVVRSGRYLIRVAGQVKAVTIR